eukprot:4796864-Prymnesium_polylepis.1
MQRRVDLVRGGERGRTAVRGGGGIVLGRGLVARPRRASGPHERGGAVGRRRTSRRALAPLP